MKNMLTPVRCVKERIDFPEQCKRNRVYWVDEQSKYEFDGEIYINVYRDAWGTQKIGNFDISRFKDYINYTRYDGTLEHYINNTEEGVLLKDIVEASEDNVYVSYYKNILDYIKDKGYYTDEYMFTEFVVKSGSFQKFLEAGREDEYTKYCGYSAEPIKN